MNILISQGRLVLKEIILLELTQLLTQNNNHCRIYLLLYMPTLLYVLFCCNLRANSDYTCESHPV